MEFLVVWNKDVNQGLALSALFDRGFSVGVRRARRWDRLFVHFRLIQRGVGVRVLPFLSDVCRCQDGDSFYLVVRHFPVTVVVGTQPKGSQPTIVRLPVWDPRAVKAIAAVNFRALTRSCPLRGRARVGRPVRVFERFVVRSRDLLSRRVASDNFLVDVRRLQFRYVVFQ